MPENISLKAAEEVSFLKTSCSICYEAQVAQDSLTVILKILTQSHTPESTNTRSQMLSEGEKGMGGKKKKKKIHNSPVDKTYQTMSPKTVKSNQERWCWKKYFAFFNIFHQIILKQFTKVGVIPIIQMGKLRHKPTTQFSQYYITRQQTTACTLTSVPCSSPRTAPPPL